MSTAPRAVRSDGEATRGRIIEAAGELVAVNGFAQTQSKDIAARAKVDLASINYHFGGRDGLYQVLLAAAHRGVIALPELDRMLQTDAPARDRLRLLIAFLLSRTSQARSWHGRVLAREMLSPSPQLRGLLEEELRPKVTVVTGLLSEITGIPLGHPALLRAMLSIGAPCAVLLGMGANIPQPFQPAITESHADTVAHFQAFALAGLEAIGQQYAAGLKKAPKTAKTIKPAKSTQRRSVAE